MHDRIYQEALDAVHRAERQTTDYCEGLYDGSTEGHERGFTEGREKGYKEGFAAAMKLVDTPPPAADHGDLIFTAFLLFICVVVIVVMIWLFGGPQ